jgi:hypothetical protein
MHKRTLEPQPNRLKLGQKGRFHLDTLFLMRNTADKPLCLVPTRWLGYHLQLVKE